jgi:hypothetical protein
MIKVSMRQDDRVDFTRRDGQFSPVAFTPFLLPLEESAIDQNLNSFLAVAVEGSIDEMLGAGHRAGRAEELNVGQTLPPELPLKATTEDSNVREAVCATSA